LASPGLLGDYFQALRVMENIELSKRGLYRQVAACHVTIFYYVGFCYLMMGRYEDTVRTYSDMLTVITRLQQSAPQKISGYVISKKRTQLFNLLAIALTINPKTIDQSVQTQLGEICGEKMIKMQKGDLSTFKEVFAYGCPKFVMPTAPDYSKLTEDSLNAPFQLQCKVFMSELEQSLKLPLIRSYLKLYSTMSVEKLAQFCELTVDEFRIHLHQ
jgi:translation initiation factor 3 subunit L